MEKAKLTDKIAKTRQLPVRGETMVWDTETSGFGLRLRHSGGRTWFVKRGRNRYLLGSALDRPCAEARAEAMTILATLASGKVPERKTRVTAPRVSDLMSAYMVEHVATHCSQSTFNIYTRVIKLHINRLLGDRTVDSIVPRDIDKMMSELAPRPIAANQALALLKAAMQKGMRWGIRTPALGNPAQGTQTFDSDSHEEFLEASEFRIVLAAMEVVARRPNRWHASMCLRLLALTGCRRDEMRLLAWGWIDWERSRINWPNTKTGKGHLVINKAAEQVIAEVRDYNTGRETDHLFRGMDHTLPLPRMTLYRTWAEVKELAAELGVDAARLKRLRPHDLRHSFATLGLSSGLSLEDVGRLLRHKDSRSTKRYARHLPSREIELAAKSEEFLAIV